MSYYELRFNLNPFFPTNEILIAKLNEIGFESFVEEKPILLAYISKDEFKEEPLKELLLPLKNEFEIDYFKSEIKKENWNKKWEDSFEPIEINNFCRIRAPFHSPSNKFSFELIIEPKMSFGTGHHETTQLMIEMIQNIFLEEKKVLDMGSGTGVLAILAEKMGAIAIDAIDIEEWAYINIRENIERNNCTKINAQHGGKELLDSNENYDLILANINKNILKDQFNAYSDLQKKGQKMLISGFYDTDLNELSLFLSKFGYIFDTSMSKNNWTAALFVKG